MGFLFNFHLPLACRFFPPSTITPPFPIEKLVFSHCCILRLASPKMGSIPSSLFLLPMRYPPYPSMHISYFFKKARCPFCVSPQLDPTTAALLTSFFAHIFYSSPEADCVFTPFLWTLDFAQLIPWILLTHTLFPCPPFFFLQKAPDLLHPCQELDLHPPPSFP